MNNEFKLKTQDELIEEYQFNVSLYRYYRDQVDLTDIKINDLLNKQDKIKRDIEFYQQINSDYKASTLKAEKDLRALGIMVKDFNGCDLL